MSRDRAAFAFGLLAPMLAGLGLWSAYGRVDWQLAGMLAPVVMVVAGIGILVLSRRPH